MRGRGLSFLAVVLILIVVSTYLSFSGNQGLAALTSGYCKIAGEEWSYDANDNFPPFDCCPGFRACPDGYCCEVENKEKTITEQITSKPPSALSSNLITLRYTCYQDSDCGTDGWLGQDYCTSGGGENTDVADTYRTYTCHNPGTSSAYCTHTDEDMVKEDCGDTEYGDWGDPYCSGGDVWHYRWCDTRGCGLGGEVMCYNIGGTQEEKLEECGSYTCTDGTCDFECYSDSDCGTDGWLGQDYCTSGGGENTDVADTYRTYTCNNPGTPSAYCTHTDEDLLKEDCGDTECGDWGDQYCSDDDVYHNRSCTWRGCDSNICYENPGTEEEKVTECGEAGCSNGSCNINYVCYQDSDCGTDGWLGQDYCTSGGGENTDVADTYRTYTCNNPGTPSAYCTHTDEDMVKEDCGDTEYGPWGDPYCYDDDGGGEDVFHLREAWWRGCGQYGCYLGHGADIEKVTECGSYTCTDGACIFECYQDSDCGTDDWLGNPYCSGDDVYQSYRTYTCENPGTINANCSYTDEDLLKEDCGEDGCSNGSCNINYVCYQDSDCGTDGWLGQDYCTSGGGENTDVADTYRTYTCENPGTINANCYYTDEDLLKEDCGDTEYGDWSDPYCYDGDVYHSRSCTYRSCGSNACYENSGTEEEKVTECGDKVCVNGECAEPGDFPDLEVSNLRVMWPLNPNAGEIISFEFKIKNIGEKIAENIEFELLTGESNWDSPQPITLEIGEEIYITYDHTYNNPGTYIVTAVTDPGNQIIESDESNNQESIIVVIS